MRGALSILLLLLTAPVAHAEGGWTEAISGEVRAGEDFTADLPGGLVFVLEAARNAPPNPPGWVIAIRQASSPDPDLVWPANPPYRFDNVRYLDTGYGKSVEQMLQWNPRLFHFYDDPAAAEAAIRWIEAMVLHPTDAATPPRPDPRGVAVLNVLESRVGVIGGGPAVTWLRFEARFSVEP
jgi:hypothetical protein